MATAPIALPIPAAPEEKDIRGRCTLPSGINVTFLRGKGRDLRMALMAAGPRADQYRIMTAMVGQLALFDGKKRPMESIDEMDFDDVADLISEAGKYFSPLGKTRIAATATLESEEVEKAEEPLVQ